MDGPPAPCPEGQPSMQQQVAPSAAIITTPIPTFTPVPAHTPTPCEQATPYHHTSAQGVLAPPAPVDVTPSPSTVRHHPYRHPTHLGLTGQRPQQALTHPSGRVQRSATMPTLPSTPTPAPNSAPPATPHFTFTPPLAAHTTSATPPAHSPSLSTPPMFPAGQIAHPSATPQQPSVGFTGATTPSVVAQQQLQQQPEHQQQQPMPAQSPPPTPFGQPISYNTPPAQITYDQHNREGQLSQAQKSFMEQDAKIVSLRRDLQAATTVTSNEGRVRSMRPEAMLELKGQNARLESENAILRTRLEQALASRDACASAVTRQAARIGQLETLEKEWADEEAKLRDKLAKRATQSPGAPSTSTMARSLSLRDSGTESSLQDDVSRYIEHVNNTLLGTGLTTQHDDGETGPDVDVVKREVYDAEKRQRIAFGTELAHAVDMIKRLGYKRSALSNRRAMTRIQAALAPEVINVDVDGSNSPTQPECHALSSGPAHLVSLPGPDSSGIVSVDNTGNNLEVDVSAFSIGTDVVDEQAVRHVNTVRNGTLTLIKWVDTLLDSEAFNLPLADKAGHRGMRKIRTIMHEVSEALETLVPSQDRQVSPCRKGA